MCRRTQDVEMERKKVGSHNIWESHHSSLFIQTIPRKSRGSKGARCGREVPGGQGVQWMELGVEAPTLDRAIRSTVGTWAFTLGAMRSPRGFQKGCAVTSWSQSQQDHSLSQLYQEQIKGEANKWEQTPPVRNPLMFPGGR